MCEELVKMINDNKLSVHSYFTMAPYIAPFDTQYRKIADQINYFNDFNVVTDQTILHLAKLAKVAQNDSIKLLVLTGYCGSGKTNFLRFCEAIIQKKTVLEEYEQIQAEIEHLYRLEASPDAGIVNDEPDFFDESQKIRQNEIKTLHKNFTDSLGKIKRELNSVWLNENISVVKKQISAYLNQHLRGKVIFFDFDADKRDDKEPLELKLTRQIEDYIKEIGSPNLMEVVYSFYEKNKNEITKAFENRYDYYLGKAIKILYKNRNKTYEEYQDDFLQAAKNLAVDQLLSIAVFLGIAQEIDKDSTSEERVYYMLDNIDMISGPDNSTLIKTIGNFWNFIEEMQSLMHSLSQKKQYNEENRRWIDTYCRFKYIFAMRETTSMHIGDHLRSRIMKYAEHIDVSSDVNKSFIIKKRYNLLKKYIDDGIINNKSFVNTTECIEKITEDKFFRWSFFSLFNNDYRVALDCLNEICNLSDSSIPSAFSLLHQNAPYMKFGGRGIVIRALCNVYKKYEYFKSLRIPYKGYSPKRGTFDITLIRMILTVLTNLTKEKISADNGNEFPFFVMRETSVSLQQLYDEVAILCGNNEEDCKNTFLDCIEAMFSARSWNFWNHLVTFDNAPKYSRSEFLMSLGDLSGEKSIFIRCTKAGEQYLKTLCIHYEFFACRYSPNGSGLFSMKNYRKVNGRYGFSEQIKTVYENVQACCKELKRMNDMIVKSSRYNNYDDYLNSHYVIDHKFHEERIIHNHISYLDAYRMYLINNPLKDDVIDVNIAIIEYINYYIELLKYDDSEDSYYSLNSKKLYSELKGCVEHIEQNGYNDTTTMISRDYYNSVLFSTSGDQE